MGMGRAFQTRRATVTVRRAMNVLLCLFAMTCSLLAEAAERFAVPSDADQKAALTTVKDVFKTELSAAKSGAQLSDLAEKMLSSVQGDAASAASDYMLLTQAQALAIRGSNISLTMNILTTLGEKFDVDQRTLTLNAIRDLAKGPTDKDFHQQLANLSIRMATECRQAERLDLALQFLVQTDAIAGKLKSTELTKRSAGLKAEINDQKKLTEKHAEAQATLKTKPEDAAANDARGRYLVVVKGDWDEGLKHLVRSSDKELRAAAQDDTTVIDGTAVPTPDQVLKLADQWWDVSQKQTSPSLKSAIKLRAGQWYEIALPDQKGLAKAKAEQRLTESEFKADSPQAALMPTNRAAFLVDRAIADGKGVITRNYAICQTLSFERAMKLHVALEARKMRPFRFRPYPTPEGLKVAAIWLRSNRTGIVFDGTGEETKQRFETAIKDKMYPVDLAGYLTQEGQVRYVMLLTPSGFPEGTEFELTIGFRVKDGRYGKGTGIAPTSRTFFIDNAGDCCVNVTWRKPKATYYYARTSRAVFEKSIAKSELMFVDVAYCLNEQKLEYTYIEHKLDGTKSVVVHDKSLDETVALWRDGVPTTGTPVSISVVIDPDGQYRSMSVWHVPVKN